MNVYRVFDEDGNHLCNQVAKSEFEALLLAGERGHWIAHHAEYLREAQGIS